MPLSERGDRRRIFPPRFCHEERTWSQRFSGNDCPSLLHVSQFRHPANLSRFSVVQCVHSSQGNREREDDYTSPADDESESFLAALR